MDAWDIINARCRAQLADNSDRFPALSSVFDNVEYPKDFKHMNIQKYNGKQDPAQWLRLYSTSISVAGEDTNTKVLYLPMALEPAPLTWLESLAHESIHSWEDLKKAFVDNFQGSKPSSYSPRPVHDQAGARRVDQILHQALLRHKSYHPQRRR